MSRTHRYSTSLAWTGTTAAGYRDYDRSHRVSVAGTGLTVTADAPFGGDPGLANPEQLLLAAASSCQLLSFLALAAREGVDVRSYTDAAEAFMPVPRAVPGERTPRMRITEIVLRPHIVIAPGSDPDRVHDLVAQGHEECFIANTVTATMRLEPTIETAG